MAVDLDLWIEKIKKCEPLDELELQTLCEYVRTVILESYSVGFA